MNDPDLVAQFNADVAETIKAVRDGADIDLPSRIQLRQAMEAGNVAARDAYIGLIKEAGATPGERITAERAIDLLNADIAREQARVEQLQAQNKKDADKIAQLRQWYNEQRRETMRLKCLLDDIANLLTPGATSCEYQGEDLLAEVLAIAQAKRGPELANPNTTAQAVQIERLEHVGWHEAEHQILSGKVLLYRDGELAIIDQAGNVETTPFSKEGATTDEA